MCIYGLTIIEMLFEEPLKDYILVFSRLGLTWAIVTVSLIKLKSFAVWGGFFLHSILQAKP